MPRMPFVADDGGRAAAGFKGDAGDCVCRSIAIASGLPYRDVYSALAAGTGAQRVTVRDRRAGRIRHAKTAGHGIAVRRQWFKGYMASLGFRWVPTMKIGSGCTVHLADGELPMGRLVVAVSKHYTAVIDGVVHDTFDPQRETLVTEGGVERVVQRCVYGYFVHEGA